MCVLLKIKNNTLIVNDNSTLCDRTLTTFKLVILINAVIHAPRDNTSIINNLAVYNRLSTVYNDV